MPETTEPRKVRWTVPAIDTSVSRWLDAQVSISNSLSALIRDAIERDGYADVVHRPVEQLPRRGRPPQSESTERAGEEPVPLTARAAVAEAGGDAYQEREIDVVTATQYVAEALSPSAVAAVVPVADPTETEVAVSPEAGTQPAPASAPTQIDMNAIFGHGE